MRIPSYEATTLQPLTSPVLIEERVRALIGRACRRQVWFLFLDDDLVQLPLLMPFDDLPSAPGEVAPELARAMGRAMDAAGAASTIVVIERYASSALTPSDLAWARALHDAFELDERELRGILLSHNRGVRWVAQDDYRF